MKIQRLNLIALVASGVMIGFGITACGAPTPSAAPTSSPATSMPTTSPLATDTILPLPSPTISWTVTPTPLPPTQTPVPPTATPPPPTNTPLPPTNTIMPTHTPQPKKTAAPRPAATAAPATSSLAKAIEMTLTRTDDLYGIRDRLKLSCSNGPGGEVCRGPFPLKVELFPCQDYIADYNAIVTAPAFDVSQKSSVEQSAYAMYRQAVSIMTEGAKPIVDTCAIPEAKVTFDAYNTLWSTYSNAHDLLASALASLRQ